MLYTYTKLKNENNEYLKYIKSIILLSFVDVSAVFNMFVTPETIEFAKKKAEEHKEMELMPFNSFLSPISIKNYLRYIKMKEEINEIDLLEEVDIPIFMRWGSVRELIPKPADEHAKYIESLIKNEKKDIGYIDGANHSYDNKENQLSEEISKFLQKYCC